MGARAVALCLGVIALSAPSASRADLLDTIGLGGFVGVRFTSENSRLGTDDPDGTSIGNGFELGPRITAELLPWLSIEGELPVMFATTRNDESTGVIVIDPRAHAAFSPPLEQRWLPFADGRAQADPGEGVLYRRVL